MNRFETECRRLIDGLVRELAALADDLAQNEIRAARAAQKAEERKAPKVSPRLARALERAEERRRLAAERRAQKLAQRAARRAAVGDGQPAPTSARTRARTAAAPVEVIPPPLFVHKRSRDGSIQKLERPAGEPAPAAAAVPS